MPWIAYRQYGPEVLNWWTEDACCLDLEYGDAVWGNKQKGMQSTGEEWEEAGGWTGGVRGRACEVQKTGMER